VGTYTFSIQVKGSKPNTVKKTFTLGVYANMGDSCNNLSWDVAGTSTPIQALTDLGTGTYEGEEGGLYPDGANVYPSAQYAYGLSLAQSIGPLSSTGQPDPPENMFCSRSANPRRRTSSTDSFQSPTLIPRRIPTW